MSVIAVRAGIIAVSIFCIGAVGCGGSPANPDGGTPQPDLATAQEVCTSDGKAVALAQRYAIQARLNVNVKVPSDCAGESCILDKDAKAGIILLANLTQNGQSVTVAASTCQIQIPPVALKGQPMPTQLTAPDALVQAVPVVTTTSTIDGPNTCANLDSMPLAIVLGARLAMPATDAVPVFDKGQNPPVKLCGGSATTKCSAAMDTGCICDQEGDGKLGATVEASGVPALDDVDKVYLALRAAFTLRGQVYPPQVGGSGQRLKGRVTDLALTQSPVGCHRTTGADCDAAISDSVAKLNPKVSQSVNTISTFTAVPVGGNMTCAEVVSQAGTLFQ